MKLNVGDPVTLMWCGGVRHGVVSHHAFRGSSHRAPRQIPARDAHLDLHIRVDALSLGAHRTNRALQKPYRHSMHGTWNEGVTWIHGHHAKDSPEVCALLAAYALQRRTP